MSPAPKKAVIRCAWAGNDAEYQRYHDEEWGVPLKTDVAIFEKLVLEGFQAGLSWITILRKRENFRRAFDKFEPERIARYGAKVEAAAARPVGKLSGLAIRGGLTTENPLGDLVADAQLAASRAPDKGSSQVAFMNPAGVRADLQPAADGTVTYGQIFASQPWRTNVGA